MKDQSGTVVVLVAAAMIGLIGMAALVIDGGYLYTQKAKLQTLADASALAGARELPDTDEATNRGQEFAVANGLQVSDVLTQDVSSPGILRVTVRREVAGFFTKLFGFDKFTVTASAAARKSRPLLPLGVVPPDFKPDVIPLYPYVPTAKGFQPGTEYTIKYGGGNGSTGNYNGLAFDGSGAANFSSLLLTGYSGPVAIGDTPSTEPGAMTGPTEKSFEDRVPITVITPLITTLPKGRETVTVISFALFKVTEVSGGKITAEFQQTLTAEELANHRHLVQLIE